MVDLNVEMTELWGALGAPPVGRPHVIQFISARRGEGTSTVAREFARFASRRAGRKTWLIDLDLNSPSQFNEIAADPNRFGPLGPPVAGTPPRAPDVNRHPPPPPPPGGGGGGRKSADPQGPRPHGSHSESFFIVTEDLDMFGLPYIVKPTKRGRPAHEVTKQTRNRVNMLVAMGWANQRIASAMGVTLPTLHKYYFYELRQRDVARDRLEVRRMELIWSLAESGNVGAFKEFAKLLERNDRMEIERELASDEKTKPPAPERVGKKVADQQKALDADAALAAELELEVSQNARH